MNDNEEVIVTWNPSGEGICEQCGNVTRSARVKTCDDCKAANKATSTSATTRAPKVKVGRVGGAVTPTKAAGTFAKLLILISVIWAWSAIKRYGIPDVTGALAEELAFTDEEAADLAKPLGRLSMSNSATAKVVGPIVENDDLIDAGFALWEWRKRVDQALAQYKGNMIADNQRGGAVNEYERQDAESVTNGAGEYDPLSAGYDANRDARVT